MRAGQRSLMRGFLWLGSASVFARIVDLAAIIVVLRSVSTEQIGEASLAWTVITLSEPFASLGVSSGLLTVRRLDRLALDTALWLSVFGGVGLALLVAALAPLIGWLASTPSVAPLVAVGALKLVPAAAATVPQQRLARALRQREIAAASAAATLLSAAMRVLLAQRGWGAWAFVLAQVGYSTVLLAALWLLAPLHPRIRLDERRSHELVSLGMPSALGNAFVQWARNVDFLFVGAFLGMAPLGLYRVAFDLAMEPIVAAGDVVARSAAPTLRRLARSPAELQRGFNYSVKLVLATALPLALAVFALAPRLLELIKDASFAPAAAAARWLVIASVMRVLLGLYTPLAMALGRPGLSLRSSLELLVLLSLALALFIGALGGALSITSAGIAWCAALGLSLALTRLRFRAAMQALPVAAPIS
jgi:O-antigen/teichoic acid export membrane protein